MSFRLTLPPLATPEKVLIFLRIARIGMTFSQAHEEFAI